MAGALELSSVVKRYGTGPESVLALDDVSLIVQQQEIVAVTGQSGSGKSTLLNVAAGFDSVDRGQVLVNDEDLTTMSQTDRARFRRRSLGFVFQAFHLLPELTVSENVALPLLLAGNRDMTAAETLLDSVGLTDKASKFPAELSGGEQQRVAIARSLVNDPTLILADEPTGNLDSETGDAIIELLLSRARSAGAALVLVTHNAAIAALGERRVTMKDGVVVEAVPQTR